jgi:hypothetical protein
MNTEQKEFIKGKEVIFKCTAAVMKIARVTGVKYDERLLLFRFIHCPFAFPLLLKQYLNLTNFTRASQPKLSFPRLFLSVIHFDKLTYLYLRACCDTCRLWAVMLTKASLLFTIWKH